MAPLQLPEGWAGTVLPAGTHHGRPWKTRAANYAGCATRKLALGPCETGGETQRVEGATTHYPRAAPVPGGARNANKLCPCQAPECTSGLDQLSLHRRQLYPPWLPHLLPWITFRPRRKAAGLPCTASPLCSPLAPSPASHDGSRAAPKHQTQQPEAVGGSQRSPRHRQQAGHVPRQGSSWAGQREARTEVQNRVNPTPAVSSPGVCLALALLYRTQQRKEQRPQAASGLLRLTAQPRSSALTPRSLRARTA